MFSWFGNLNILLLTI